MSICTKLIMSLQMSIATCPNYSRLSLSIYDNIHRATFYQSEITLSFYAIIPCHRINSVSIIPCLSLSKSFLLLWLAMTRHSRHGIKILPKISQKTFHQKSRAQFWFFWEIPACARPDRYLEDAHAGIFVFCKIASRTFGGMIIPCHFVLGILKISQLKLFFE